MGAFLSKTCQSRRVCMVVKLDRIQDFSSERAIVERKFSFNFYHFAGDNERKGSATVRHQSRTEVHLTDSD